MNKLERDIEKNLGMILEEWDCLYLKFVSPGHAGVPDRIILTPGGHIVFVELKQAGKQLRPLQVFWQKTLKRMHFAAFVVSDNDSARKCLGYVLEILRQEEDNQMKERLNDYDI